MAKKIARPAPTPPAEPTDLVVLHPDHKLVLAGEKLEVREYRNLEWLRLLPAAEPLVTSIAAQLTSPEPPSYESALAVIAENADTLMPLVVQSIDRDLAFVERISKDELELLLMAWWGVNGHFFVRRASNRVLIERQEAALADRLAGAKSTPSSSPTATGAPSSVAIPPAS